ncbi:MAG TPA: hypothetical protein PKK00_08170 [Bacteroidales bacterium]|nr:hypothetical protein [Bacteroidales bacterium]HPS17315.1 hypothetical protein [Bacteroidales bacterium]
MIRIERMIIIGATARHSGKTELASSIIKNFSDNYKITGIKISTIHEGDNSFHGNIESLNENFTIKKNTVTRKEKSTDRMISSGAQETFWIHTKAEFLNIALQELLPMLDKNSFYVCESNSLRKLVQPDIFIMIKNLNKEIKNTATEVLNLADYIINFNGKEFINFDISKIEIEKGKWILK